MIPKNMLGLYICFGLVIAVLTVLVVAGSVCYVMGCLRWRRRIAEVREGQPVYLGWNCCFHDRGIRETILTSAILSNSYLAHVI